MIVGRIKNAKAIIFKKKMQWKWMNHRSHLTSIVINHNKRDPKRPYSNCVQLDLIREK